MHFGSKVSRHRRDLVDADSVALTTVFEMDSKSVLRFSSLRKMSKRMLSNFVLRSITHSPGSRPLFGLSLRYSTKITGDSDTHDDFHPTDKLKGSGISMLDVVQQDVKINPVMIYMKGVPDAPRCGFSALAVKVLQQHGVPISSRDILENPALKEGVKAFSNWPTFPQIFVKGNFIGGSDIVLEMHQNGQLKELLSNIDDVSADK